MSRALVATLAAALSLVLGSCAHHGVQVDHEPVDLEPNDPRPISSIQVADGHEVEILIQETGLEPLFVRGSTLYFFDDPKLAPRLAEVGYDAQSADPRQVFERVVRVARQGEEAELLQTSVSLINREETHWVVRGSLAQLTALERIGYRLTPIQLYEPRPREIEVVLDSLDDAQVVNRLHVDIFTVIEDQQELRLYGAAFDHQIDELRARGFDVRRISTVGEGESE